MNRFIQSIIILFFFLLVPNRKEIEDMVKRVILIIVIILFCILAIFRVWTILHPEPEKIAVYIEATVYTGGMNATKEVTTRKGPYYLLRREN